MRRFWLLVVLLCCGATHRASAQVRVSVGVTLDSTRRHPVVRLEHLFDVREWRDAVEAGVGVQVKWTLTQWRRGTLLQTKVREYEWQDIVRRQALFNQYDIRQIYPAPRQPQPPVRFETLDLLAYRQFAQPLLVRVPTPTEKGEYYYSVDVTIATLADDETETAFRAQGNRSIWEMITRPVGSYFLPRERFTGQSATFRIP